MFAQQLLSIIGVWVVLKTLRSATTYIRLAVGGPTVTRLIHSSKSYALVTGATDGLGKATVLELQKRGFNVILHGRDAEKLRALQETMKEQSTKDVRIWVQDASAADIDFASAVEQWKDLEITLVVHNVGIAVAKPYG